MNFVQPPLDHEIRKAYQLKASETNKRNESNGFPAIKGIFDRMIDYLTKPFGEMIGREITKVDYAKGEKERLTEYKDYLVDNELITIEKVIGKDEAELESVLIEPSVGLHIDKVMLVCLGMGDCYEKHLDSFRQLAEDTGVPIVAFNYRGVEESGKGVTAVSKEDIIADGILMVEHLEKKGITSDNILIYGHSMGGGVAAEVYKHKKHKGPIISESSFSTFKKAVESKRGAFMGWLFDKLNWNFNGIGILESTENKNKFGLIVNRRDPTVPYENTSLYKEAKNRGVEGPSVIKIGRKNEKEIIRKYNVEKKKMVSKHPKDEADIKGKHDNRALNDYEIKYKRIKNNNLISELRHPHQMIMDQKVVKNDVSPKMKEIRAEIAAWFRNDQN